MKKSIGSVFLAFVFLAILVSGCAPAPTPVPSTSTPLPTNTPLPTKTPAPTNTSVPTKTPIPKSDTPTSLNLEWLVTEKDINEFTNDIEIFEWKLDEELPGNNRICRIFTGTSWSANSNFSMNCLNLITAGSTFEDVIASMYDADILYSTDIQLKPILEYDYDFALYAHSSDNGHSVFDAFLVNNGLLYRASVSVGTPATYTPEKVFDAQGEIIEAFLKNMLMINLDRVGR
ncbi:MAG TPA: hypothetical protein VN843_21465 [Anaerolineales bacterium]|nr:hypothetical protein [Anaerolineales bacterium]